jgi:hypothetical protein
MNNTSLRTLSAVATILIACANMNDLKAQSIDFEGISVSEGQAVGTVSGVSFSNALVAKQGGSFFAFGASHGTNTGLTAPFNAAGNTFIIASGGDRSDSLLMDFTSFPNGIGQLSFNVCDIDATEVFVIEVLGRDMNVLKTIILSDPAGDPDTGDGVVATISFSMCGTFYVGTTNVNPSFPIAGHGIDNLVFSEAPDPAELLENLILDVAEINLARGLNNAVDAKLAAAFAAINDVNEHNDVAACNVLDALVYFIEVQRDHEKLSTEQAQFLIDGADLIICLLCE